MTVSTDVTEGNKNGKADSAHNSDKNILGIHGLLLQAKGLTVRTRAGVDLLSDISFHIEPGELVALIGPSRSGKSALLQSLAGLLKPSSGEILMDGIPLYVNLKAFRSSIGFVPARFPFQRYLTVIEILQDSARLRLPRSVSKNDRQQRVQALLETLKLNQVANQRVELLSKFEKRRLSIAVELTGDPGLLLLDESTDRLTSFEEVQITSLLQELTQKGLTVIQVIESSKCVSLSEKVILFAPGGFLAWFGPASETFGYLRSFKPGGSINEPFGLEESLALLTNPQMGEGAEWAKRFIAHPAFIKYVDDPLNDRYPDLLLQEHPLIRLRSSAKEKRPPVIVARANVLQKLSLLVRRNSRSMWRGKTWLLMLAVPPVIALVDFVLSSPNMLNPQLGDPYRPPVVLGVLVFLDLLVAALLFQNEIFKERDVYQREHRTTSLAFPYILSKTWLVALLAVYQGLVWAVVHFASTGFTENFPPLFQDGVTFILVAFIGGILGLLASTLSRTAMMTTGLVLIFTIPQLFLSESIIPLKQLNFPFGFLSWVDPSRYAFEALLTTSGYGQAIATDACWQTPTDRRNALSDSEKQGCKCFGENLYSVCTFPGILALFSTTIEVLKPDPPTPDSPLDNAAYEARLTQYATDLANWQKTHSEAIGTAQGVISEALDHYGLGFNVILPTHWLILAGISFCFVILLIGIQQGKGIAKK